MNKPRTRLLVTIILVTLVATWAAPISNAEDDDCLICVFASVPDPGGGDPTIHHICLDLGEEVGWAQCFECVNCSTCIMFIKCYWSWW